MAKNERVVTQRSHSILKPQGTTCIKRSVQIFDALPKSQNHFQEIAHKRKARGHNAVFDTGAQQLMIGRDGWEIIKRHDTWIDAKGVDLGGTPKVGRH